MADKPNNTVALEVLLQTLKENPDLWETRKKTATLLFEDERYLEAADIVWNAPTIPSTDVDVAFSLKVISRVKPNRSIRLVYEVLKRNKGKPLKNMAVARALNEAGLYMEAARFYGAALADDTSLFDLAFEKQVLWLDDSGRLLEEWKKSDQESKPPLDVPEQDITGGTLNPQTLPEDTYAEATGQVSTPALLIPGNSTGGTSGTKPLMMNSAATTQTSPLATAPAGANARPLGAPAGGNPLLQPAATNAPAASPAALPPVGGTTMRPAAAAAPQVRGTQTSPLSVNPLGGVPGQQTQTSPLIPGGALPSLAPAGHLPPHAGSPPPPAPPQMGRPTPALRRAPAAMQPTPTVQAAPPVQQPQQMRPAMPVPTQPLIMPGMGAVPPGYPQPGYPQQVYGMPGMVPPGYPQPVMPGYPPQPSYPVVPPRPMDPGPNLRLQ